MIKMTLAEVATAVGGTLHAADPDAVVTGPVELRLPQGGPGRPVRRPSWGSGWTGTTSPPPRSPPERSACWAPVRSTGCPWCWWRPARRAGGAWPGLLERLTGAERDRVDRIVRARRPPRTTSPQSPRRWARRWPRPGPQQRARLPVHRAARRRRHPLPGARVGARGSAIRTCANRAGPDRRRAQRGVAHLGEFGRWRRSPRPRGSWWRRCRRTVAVLNADDPQVAAMATAHPGPGAAGRSGPRRRRARHRCDPGRAGPPRVHPGGRRRQRSGAAGDGRRPPGRQHPRRGRSAWRWDGRTSAGRGAGPTAAGLTSADGRLRPARRGDGHRRLLQRQSGLHGGGLASVGDSWAGSAHHRRAGIHGGAGRPRGRRTRGRWAGSPPTSAWTRSVVVGEAAPIDAGARSRPGWRGESVPVTDQDAAVAVLRDRLRPGDVVLVKGSRYRTWQVADWLRAPVTAAADGVVVR